MQWHPPPPDALVDPDTETLVMRGNLLSQAAVFFFQFLKMPRNPIIMVLSRRFSNNEEQCQWILRGICRERFGMVAIGSFMELFDIIF
jgi:hypothetical protein